MAVTNSDIIFYYSGGATNADPALSLGGEQSLVEVIPSEMFNLFDRVSLLEAAAGRVEYRCLYVGNTASGEDMSGARLYIKTQTPSAHTAIAIGLDPAGVNGEATSIALETTAPIGVTFADYPPAGNGLEIGDLNGGEAIAFWVRRVVNPGAVPRTLDNFTIQLTGIPE